MQKILFLVLAIGIIAFFSCKKDQLSNSPTDAELVMNDISSYFGYDQKNLQIVGDEVIAEGDISFHIPTYWSNYGAKTDEVVDRLHYKSTYQVSTPNPPRYITINVLPGVPVEWANAIYDACVMWNARNLNVRFAAQSGQYHTSGMINVSMAYYQNQNEVAVSNFPTSNGNPGSFIKINSNGIPLSSTKKKLVIAHEIGHTIGFHHTDGNKGTLITNVSTPCKDNYDPSSLMQTVLPANCTGFSDCDKQAFDAIY